MQVLMNKKFLNRIQRRSANLIPSQHEKHQPQLPIKTFRTINVQNNKILQSLNYGDKNPIQIQSILSFCRQLSRKRKRFVDLAKPKRNSCSKSYMNKTNQWGETNNLKSIQNDETKNKFKSSNINRMNKTISFSSNRANTTRPISRPKSVYQQDDLDLKNEQFKRRHQSLKLYENSSIEQINGASKNTIISNSIGKLSITEILQIKRKQSQKRQLFRGLLKNGQVSNEPGQSEKFRQLSAFMTIVAKSADQQKMQQVEPYLHIFDQKTSEKYQTLLDTIHHSQIQYPVEPYQNYDRALTQRFSTYRTKKTQKHKILLNCGEGWR